MCCNFGAFQVIHFESRPGTLGGQNNLEFPDYLGHLLSEIAASWSEAKSGNNKTFEGMF